LALYRGRLPAPRRYSPGPSGVSGLVAGPRLGSLPAVIRVRPLSAVQRAPASAHVLHPVLDTAAIRHPGRLSRRSAPRGCGIVGLRLRVLPLTSQKHLFVCRQLTLFSVPSASQRILPALHALARRQTPPENPRFRCTDAFRSLVVRQPSPVGSSRTNFQGSVSKPPGSPCSLTGLRNSAISASLDSPPFARSRE